MYIQYGKAYGTMYIRYGMGLESEFAVIQKCALKY